MTVPARLSLVTLGVADVTAAAGFYERLGWRRSSASIDGTVAFFQLGCVALSLYGTAALADDALQPASSGGGPGAGFRGVTLAINLESVDEVDRVFAAWVAAGATPVKSPEAVFWGGYSAYVADPDGHLWELAHNPGFVLDGQGAVHLPD